ncbi:hypothetical protein GALL_177920 [mine drainage metagenome]|uniref:Uncharacterized protein n=1 Tax=mine drainage metagenome TaxID=410659 RepID=A0A1J5RWG1_9ZZZZ
MAFSDEPNAAPEYGSLKTLTVLTFIGSALGFIGGIYQFINAEKGVENMEKAMANPDTPEFAKKMMTPEALEAARIGAANKLPILILGLIGVVLCTVGAMQMRKLKQQGYYLWLIGEVIPIIGSLLFLGSAAFAGGFMTYIIYGIILLFIILYTMQRKYLINK